MAKKKKPPKSSRKPAEATDAKKPVASDIKKRKAATRATYAFAVDRKQDSKKRCEAFASDPTSLCGSDKSFAAVLEVLTDTNEPIEVRLSAFEAIGAARFSARDFDSYRSDYITALRKTAEDKDAELRQRSLGMLSREKDGFAQKKLLVGLKNPDKALVPPEKALQLLGYDVHADVFTAARAIVAKPPNSLARQEALRLLASDPSSVSLLQKILRDKNESVEARQICATALHVINPTKYQENARELLLDKTEDPDIQAMSLTALTYFGDKDKVTGDQPLQKRVDGLVKKGTAAMKKMAQRFVRKYE